MKSLRYMIVALLVALTTGAEGKVVQVPHVYMFGFSASFTDSTIYFTEIQDIPNAWMDKKTKFLSGRDNYSYQLKNYLTEQLQQPNRVCVIFFSKNQKKAERKYEKLRKRYLTPGKDKKKKSKKRKGKKAVGTNVTSYDIRYISQQDFRFEPVDMSED